MQNDGSALMLARLPGLHRDHQQNGSGRMSGSRSYLWPPCRFFTHILLESQEDIYQEGPEGLYQSEVSRGMEPVD